MTYWNQEDRTRTGRVTQGAGGGRRKLQEWGWCFTCGLVMDAVSAYSWGQGQADKDIKSHSEVDCKHVLCAAKSCSTHSWNLFMDFTCDLFVPFQGGIFPHLGTWAWPISGTLGQVARVLLPRSLTSWNMLRIMNLPLRVILMHHVSATNVSIVYSYIVIEQNKKLILFQLMLVKSNVNLLILNKC